ncbi:MULTISPECIES: hypothetical protein [unclassified Tatumella]|uniref:hypothetical protein n=1 Tax=unclassified Tatumella TaxID=2649542 RepID=UPI001BAF809E|nr:MULTISPECIES: hypothetical protein [unclassified Tatumella]MBS0878404.1 hypothetical protein [Tatumella sp. JGM82]MBS0891200.1 hypothetical protein [Tatumella sp. JGM94]MBS0902757.1 hypothetical protein [Tatumella sp. JGM100]
MKFIQWLISLFNREKEKMTEPVIDAAVAGQPVAVSSVASQPEVVQPAAVDPAENSGAGIVATVERDLGQFYDIVKELTERFGAEYKELAIDFAKAVSVKK